VPDDIRRGTCVRPAIPSDHSSASRTISRKSTSSSTTRRCGSWVPGRRSRRLPRAVRRLETSFLRLRSIELRSALRAGGSLRSKCRDPGRARRAPARALARAKRVEEQRLKLLRNRWAFVVHLDPRAEGFDARGHRDRRARIAVGERVADQVRKHPLEAVAIPGAAQLRALGGTQRSRPGRGLSTDRAFRGIERWTAHDSGSP
jgi:hypothetical protein